jgi:hypothetical protein
LASLTNLKQTRFLKNWAYFGWLIGDVSLSFNSESKFLLSLPIF